MGNRYDEEWIELTPEMVKALKAERDRAGINVRKLIQDIGHPNLTYSMIGQWFVMGTKKCRKEVYDLLLAEMKKLASLPETASYTPPKIKPQKIEKATITLLKEELQRTGALANDLMKLLPPGKRHLARNLNNWCRKISGAAPDEEDVQLVLSVLKSLPDQTRSMRPLIRAPHAGRKKGTQKKNAKPKAPGKSRHLAGYRYISEEEWRHLCAERDRTGLSGVGLWNYADNPPVTVNGDIVTAWINRQTVSARPEDIEYVKALYASLPNRKL